MTSEIKNGQIRNHKWSITHRTRVISLSKLRKNYQSFESKRHLCSLYDVFICDDAIYHLLPKLLGKAFFSKKKYGLIKNGFAGPISFRGFQETGLWTDRNNSFIFAMHAIIDHFFHVSNFFFHCSAIKVAHTGQTIEQSVENVVSAVSEIAKIVPRGWNNIQSLNLKTSDSISLPIYTSLPEKSLVIDDTQPPKKKRKMET
ncbi:putative ribosome biogenesis protein C8F11.04 [Orbicella faveolata]|uniref:putative ribosome biogenesis protein C8F11.04 n=1 Tax=Orbicella faveolata TaxID=48498 RepID=UPI0009E315DB|nr:putative ribosome biogenesis protein C8F11.04 [Orbicella faveolata]